MQETAREIREQLAEFSCKETKYRHRIDLEWDNGDRWFILEIHPTFIKIFFDGWLTIPRMTDEMIFVCRRHLQQMFPIR